MALPGLLGRPFKAMSSEVGGGRGAEDTGGSGDRQTASNPLGRGGKEEGEGEGGELCGCAGGQTASSLFSHHVLGSVYSILDLLTAWNPIFLCLPGVQFQMWCVLLQVCAVVESCDIRVLHRTTVTEF